MKKLSIMQLHNFTSSFIYLEQSNKHFDGMYALATGVRFGSCGEWKRGFTLDDFTLQRGDPVRPYLEAFNIGRVSDFPICKYAAPCL